MRLWMVLAVLVPAIARAGTTWFPARNELGTLLFEDEWPCPGDRDFNDLVVRYNFERQTFGSQDRALMVTLGVDALGARLQSGLALRLPIATSAVDGVTGYVGTPAAGTPWSDFPLQVEDVGGEPVIWITDDVRTDLCGGASGFLNTEPTRATTTCAPLVVEIRLAQGTVLPASAPYDLFATLEGDRTRQIHRAGYAGLASGPNAADPSWFGCSDPTGAYVQTNGPVPGLPWVLDLGDGINSQGDGLQVWDQEHVKIDQAMPRILEFADGPGDGDPGYDFYKNGTVADDLFTTGAGGSTVPAPVTAPADAVDGDDDGSCVGFDQDADPGTPPVCFDGGVPGDCDPASAEIAAECRLGTGTDSLSGTTLAAETVSTSMTASPAAGDSVLAVANTSGLAAGDEVAVIVLQDTSGTAGFADVGAYEAHYVQGVSGSTLTLASPLHRPYDANDVVAVQRIPNFASETLASPTVPAFEGQRGGLLWVRATGTLTVSGTLYASGKGYTGGTAPYNVDAYQGEGEPGLGIQTNLANGIGGGGGLVTVINGSDTGGGSGGGGAGAYAGGSGANCNGRSPGGAGASPIGTSNLTRLTLGGGGGAGGSDDNLPTGGGPGGAGGGMVVLMADTLQVTGQILSNGLDGGNGASADDGGGGGGAGGSVWLRARDLQLPDGALQANGGATGLQGWWCYGNCGNVTCDGAVGVCGACPHNTGGGAGSVGQIRVDYTSITGSTSSCCSPTPGYIHGF